jgi:hypothetical protein
LKQPSCFLDTDKELPDDRIIMDERLISPTDLARRWRVSQQRISQWLDEGRLPFEVIAGRRLILTAGLRRPKKKKRGPRDK